MHLRIFYLQVLNLKFVLSLHHRLFCIALRLLLSLSGSFSGLSQVCLSSFSRLSDLTYILKYFVLYVKNFRGNYLEDLPLSHVFTFKHEFSVKI